MIVELATTPKSRMNNSTTTMKKLIVKPSPLQQKASMAAAGHHQQQQQIIVLPSNLLLNSKGNHGEQQATIFRLASATANGSPTAAAKVVQMPSIRVTTKRPAPTTVTAAVASSAEDDESDQPTRKRANLDHLTPEEKLMRRKLKNRVAAQNARDKKRVKMDEMEIKMKELEEINTRLLNENDSLRALNERLMMDEKPSLIQINPTPKAAVTIQRPTITFSNDSYSHSSNLTPPPSEHAGSEASSEAEV